MAADRTALQLLLLLWGAGVGATNKTLFFAVGGTIKLSLDPLTAGRISRILWRHDQDFLAEWSLGVFRSYGIFKGRAEVDNATGLLQIREGATGDSGRYVVEVNNVVQDQVYQVEVIKPVPKPRVWIKPLGCGPSSPRCELNCEGSTEGAGPVTYSWAEGDGGWKQSGRALVITNETAGVRTFSCRMENNISQAESDPAGNPFFQEDKPPVISPWGIAGICVLVLVAILGYVIYRFRDEIKGCFSRLGLTAVSQKEPEEEPQLALDNRET